MSRTDVQRLAQDLEGNPGLAGEFDALGDDARAWQQRALDRGYTLTLEEAQGFSSTTRELSDDELEDVAGGWDGGTGSGGTSTSGTGGTGGG